MSTLTPSNQALRNLWLLGRRFAAFSAGADRARFKPKVQLLGPSSDALGFLGVAIDAAALERADASDRLQQLDKVRARIADAAARLHGEAARPVFALGCAAAGLERFGKEQQPMRRPDVIETAREPAARFLAAYRSTEEPVRSELEELAGWCQAIAGGWAAQFYDVTELGQLLDEAFREGAASEPPEAEEEPGYDFRTAPLEHVVSMIVLHHVLCTISGIRTKGGSAALFRGGVQAGVHAYSDQSESNFALAWSEEGIVGLAFHKYAEGEGPERWLGKIPDALGPLLAKLPRGQAWSCGFWITRDARHRDEYGTDDDGSAYIDAFASPARSALFERRDNWAAAHGLTEEQAEVALALAERAMSGGGPVSDDETEAMIATMPGVPVPPYAALTEEGLRRAQAALAQIGLVWTLPAAALERERAGIRERIEAAIAAAMSPDERALLDAARTNDAAAVTALLAKGVSPEVASVAEQFEGIPVVPGMPPLHVAIRARSTEAALALLEGGADPERAVGDLTPLVCAVQAQDVAVARACLARGARPKAGPSFALLPLAASRNDAEMVRLLIDAGADPPPAEHAARFLAQLRARGHTECADLLEATLAKR